MDKLHCFRSKRKLKKLKIYIFNCFIHTKHDYSDPNRFKLRTYSSLFEERERKRFNIELPKVSLFFSRKN